MYNQKRAQTATEYLIILAVVIIIALIVVGVLGDVPGIGGGAGQSTNEGFWQTAKIGIPTYSFPNSTTTNGNHSITIRNNLASSITITNITLNSVDIAAGSTFTQRTLQSGETWTYKHDVSSTNQQTELNGAFFSCPASSSFSVDLEITYQDVTTGSSYTYDGGGIKLEGECAS